MVMAVKKANAAVVESSMNAVVVAVVSVANALTVRRVLMARLMVVVVKVAVAAGVNGWRFLVSLWHPV